MWGVVYNYRVNRYYYNQKGMKKQRKCRDREKEEKRDREREREKRNGQVELMGS